MRNRSPFIVTNELDGSAHLARVWRSKDVSADGSFISDNRMKIMNGILEADLTYPSGCHRPRNRHGQVHGLIRLRRSRRREMDLGKRDRRLLIHEKSHQTSDVWRICSKHRTFVGHI